VSKAASCIKNTSTVAVRTAKRKRDEGPNYHSLCSQLKSKIGRLTDLEDGTEKDGSGDNEQRNDDDGKQRESGKAVTKTKHAAMM
jgi:hypothetical protein